MSRAGALCGFKLRQKFRWRKIWPRIAVIGIVAFAAAFIDLFLDQFRTAGACRITVAASVPALPPDSERISYTREEGGTCAKLSYQSGWVLEIYQKIDRPVINELRTALAGRALPELKVKEKLKPDPARELIVITIGYFGALSVSVAISQEIVEDKLSRMTEVILASLSAREHLLALLAYAWLVKLLELAYLAGMLGLGLLVRECLGNLEGYWEFLAGLAPESPAKGLGLLLIAGGGTLPYTLRAAVNCAGVRRPEEIGELMILPHLAGILNYYLMFAWYDHWPRALGWAAFVPGGNALGLPLALLKGSLSPGGALIAIVALLAESWLSLRIAAGPYRRRILDQGGARPKCLV